MQPKTGTSISVTFNISAYMEGKDVGNAIFLTNKIENQNSRGKEQNENIFFGLKMYFL